MSRRRWITLALLAALVVGLLAYGIVAGDPLYVLDNAQDFCFT